MVGDGFRRYFLALPSFGERKTAKTRGVETTSKKRHNELVGIDLLGPLRILFVIVLLVVLFGPAMKLLEFLFRKKGRTLEANDPKADSTFWWIFLGGIALTYFVAIAGRSLGFWGQ